MLVGGECPTFSGQKMATGRCSRLSDGWLFWCSLTPRHRSGSPLPSTAVWQLVLGCMDAPASVSGPSFLRFLFRLVVSLSLALALRMSFVVFSLLFFGLACLHASSCCFPSPPVPCKLLAGGRLRRQVPLPWRGVLFSMAVSTPIHPLVLRAFSRAGPGVLRGPRGG